MYRKAVLYILMYALVGCALPANKPERICPGKQNINEAVLELNRRRQQLKPIKASGDCLLQYQYDNNKHQENFPIKLWMNPPYEIYFQGDVAFDPTGLVLGANCREFWFGLKPKEISGYWWGKWSNANGETDFTFTADILMEVFGFINTLNGDWSLTRGKFDILWLHSEDGILLKRVYVDTCDYFPVKIEYFDSEGKICVVVELTKYTKLAEEYYIPMQIKIFTIHRQASDILAKITLNSAEQAQFGEQQRQRLFNRPLPKGFAHIYQIINGKAVEQQDR